jgi:tetratricopeptide (TPR) repeat protein
MQKFWLAVLVGTAAIFAQTPARNYVNEGVAAFKATKYAEAIELFQQAANAAPSDPAPHMYMAAAYVQQFIPGADSPDNDQFAINAERELQAVLGLQPENVQAMESLATLHYNRAQGKKNLAEKARAFDDAAYWYQKITGVQPENKTAHYTLGALTWMKTYPEFMKARQKLGMRLETPGPLTDADVRTELRARMSNTVEEGMRHLEKALEIDPTYDDAMAYLNLLYRERADLADSKEAYQKDVQLADTFVQRALAAKKAKGQQQQLAQNGTTAAVRAHGEGGGVAPPPPPPPPPPPGERSARPTQIRIGGDLQAAKLIQQSQPVYPALALEARIQGTVRFTATILKDGTMGNLAVLSGHPLLVPAAMDAARHYRYQPTLLNGEPVEVITQVDVSFVLP